MSEYFTAAPPGPNPSAQSPVWDWTKFAKQGLTVSQPAWSPPEAFLAILLGAVMCESRSGSFEIEELQVALHRSRALKTVAPEDFARVQAKVLEKLRADFNGALAEAGAAVPAEMRPSVFAHALDIILADGDLSQAESAFLNALVSHLSLEPNLVQAVAKVMFLKNEY